MKNKPTFKIIVTTCVCLSISLGLMVKVFAASAQSSEEKGLLPLEDVQRFSTAIGQIKGYYVENVDDSELFENAIRGMLHGLDPHSDYLDVNEYAELRNHTQGEFGGLGIEVGMEDGYIRVVSPIDDTPAAKAGIKPGDLIVRLDEKPVKGMTLREAVNIMRGKKGTSLNLTVIRKNERKLLNFDITREVIKIKSVKNRMLEDGYGYVRVSHFQSPTKQSLVKAVNELKKQSNGHLKGLVVDLRNNPGGLLDSAIDVSDLFLDQKSLKSNGGLIVYTKGRIPGAEMQAKATAGDIINGTPIVVLINEGSASGSEIVAGALQDHKRAVLMGTTTFGKGSVQTVLPLDDKRGVKLTTALYYTPAGRSIQATGIKPDITVTDMEVTQDEEQDNLVMAILKEADLSNHLANGSSSKDENKATTKTQSQAKVKTSKSDKEKEKADRSLAVEDYQLHEALNLLKALHIVVNQ